MPSDGAQPAPLVWVLTGDKAGDNAQLRILAEGLGWRWESRAIVANRAYRLPNWLLGSRLLSVDRPRSATLGPPWPDLVLTSGRRTVPVARWIRKQNHGRTRLVHLGRPWAPFRWFDLIVGMPQYRLPDAPNVFQARLPLNRIDPVRVATGVAPAPDRLASLPAPFTTVLIGGPNRDAHLDAAVAEQLGRALSAHAARHGGSLLVSTSRRTPPAVSAALAAALTVPSDVYTFRPDDPANPHFDFIAAADDLVVTSDSASMIAEACRSGKPVSVALLPVPARRKRPLWQRLGLSQRLRDRLVGAGLLVGERDVAWLALTLARTGAVRLLGQDSRPGRLPDDDLPDILARIRALFGRRLGDSTPP